MIGYHKIAIMKASLLLQKLQEEPENLVTLLELQRFLVEKIRQSERNILRLKSSTAELKTSLRRDRLPKTQAKAVKAKIKFNNERIEQYKHLVYIWKCYGDGIANIYMCKYALKHTFYSVADYAPKEDAGFLTGKEGFRLEWSLVKTMIDKDIPVMLCDITNVLRHGDVCALVSNDPVPIEVKSSNNKNKRVDRQLQHLKELRSFYENDGADEFRGVPNVKREELSSKEITYTDELNACIEQAYVEGTAVVSPEPGVHYLAIYGKFDDGKLANVLTSSSMLCTLNDIKSGGGWMPYYPFTLSLKPKYLYHFIYGDLFLAVAIDLKILKSHFQANGVHATVIDDEEFFLQISKAPKDLSQGVIRVSQHLFNRVPMEFQSIKWFADVNSHNFEELYANADPEKGPLMEIPKSWAGLSDGLDD